jgi:predicted PurR-regulated permease PerM
VRRERDPIHTAAAAVAFAAAAVVLLFVLYLARTAVLLVYVSLLLAAGFAPIVHAIEHQRLIAVGTPRLPRWFAILVMYIAIVGVLVVAALLVIPPLVAQAGELWQRLPDALDRVQTFLLERGLLSHRITLQEAISRAPGTPATAVGTVATAVGWTVGMVISAVTVLILTFYLLVESEALLTFLVRLFPRERRPLVTTAARKISAKVSAWLSGQLILAGTIGTSAAIALYLFDVPYFYVLALAAAIGELIPVVGPILSSVPAISAAFAVSPKTALAVAIFWLAQQQIENHLLVPKVMGHQVGVSPVVVIVALLVGGSVLGVIGAVLAVPTAAIVQVVVEELLEERERQLDSTANR